ncbi:unnamed protein product [Umbelopsis vinacea]
MVAYEKVTSNGIKLNAQRYDAGTGDPTLIFLHYWGGSSRTWKYVIELMPEHRSTLVYDARGWAGSDKPATGYSTENLAKDAEALIQHYNIDSYILIGHSMGAKIAQLIASRRPPGLVGLILVGPAPPVAMAIPREAREQMVYAYDSTESIGIVLDNVLTSTRLKNEDREQVIADSLSGTHAAKKAWPIDAMLEDISSQVVNINVPTLVVAAEGDKVEALNIVKQEVLLRIPGAELKVIDNSGHLMPLEAPVDLARHIIDFCIKIGY